MLRRLFHLLMWLAVTGALMSLAFGFLGHLHPALDTFSHARLHLSACLFIAALVALALTKRRLAAVSMLGFVLGIAGSLNGTVLGAETRPVLEGKQVHRLVHMNLFWLNGERKRFIDRVYEIDPLIISVTEVSRAWGLALGELEATWPHVVYCPEHGVRGGIKIFSRLPLDRTKDFCGPNGSFMLTRIVLADGRHVAIGSVHPRWPWPASGPTQYRAFEPALADIGDDALIAGDFNAVPWSHSVRNFAETGGLRIIPGIGATWLAEWMPAGLIRFIGLPLDHVMAKGRVRVITAGSIENLGSDHLPVVVEFQFE